MSIDDNYPMGAKNDPNAPYNRSTDELPKADFVIYPVVTLTGESTFSSDDYSGGYEDEMREFVPRVYSNTSAMMCDEWKRQHYTPLELLNQYKELLIRRLRITLYEDEAKEIQRKIDDCSIWTNEIVDND